MQTTPIEDSTETTPLVGKPRKGRNLTMFVLVLSNLSAFSCVSLLAPFFPIEAEKKGVNKTLIGLIYCCSELVIFLTSPIFGKILTRFSPRFFYIAGLCLFGCSDVLFGWLDKSPPGVPFIVLCFAVRIVEALGTTALSTASYVIAGSNFPDKIGVAYGLLEMSMGGGFLIGPAIGGVLYELGGFGLPFWVLGGLVFVCGCTSCFVLAEQETGEQKSSGASSFTLFRSPLVAFGSLCIVVCVIGTTTFSPIYAQHLTQLFHLKQSIIGVMFVIPAAAFSLTTPFWGWLLDKYFQPMPLLLASLVSSAFISLFFGPAPFFPFLKPSLCQSILSSTLMCATLSPGMVAGMRCIVQGTRDLSIVDEMTSHGLIAGVIQSSISLGTFSGPLIGGAVADRFGFAWTIVGVSLILLLPIICFSPLLILRLRAWCRGRAKGQQKYSKLQLADSASGISDLYSPFSDPNRVEDTAT